MFVVTVILSVILAVAFVGTGAMKATGQAQIVEGIGRLGVSPGLTRVIGLLELAAVVGLVVGLWFGALGVAAALGLVLLMIGAIGYHAKAGDYGDPKQRGPAMMPVALLVLAAATAVFRIVTL